MAVDGISDKHGGNDLVPSASKCNPDYRRDIPMQVRRLRRANQEDHHPDDREREARVAEPQSELRRRRATNLLRAAVHPGIGQDAAELLTDDGADDDAEELEAELLLVEVEFLAKELGQLDGDEDAAEEEGHGVGDGGEEDAELAAEEEGLDELIGADRGGVDAAELEVLLLEVGAVVCDARANVAGFGAEEEVKDELDAVDLLYKVREESWGLNG